MRITILDALTVCQNDLDFDELKNIADLTVYDDTKPAEVAERAHDSEFILTNKVCIGKNEIDLLPQLKYIGVLATGYNNVDTAYAREKGITVTNIPAYSTDSVAQMVFAHILNVTNDVAHYVSENRKGRWASSPQFCYADSTMHELSGKCFGIVGLGNIGMKVASIANAFGMRVCAVTSKSRENLPGYIGKCDLKTLFSSCDVISLHCPLTDKTSGMVCKELLSCSSPDLILVNTGRGPLVVEQDVADALNNRQLAAYCADVLSVEPPSATNPLLSAPNVYLTPHIAWATFEARQRLRDIAVNNVADYIAGKRVNVVN